jgi:hypothetical protein
MIPAKKGDIVKKIDSHYKNEISTGEHFVVLDVYNGDDTAVVLLPNGELGHLCFPEEYEVVDTVDDKINSYKNKNNISINGGE